MEVSGGADCPKDELDGRVINLGLSMDCGTNWVRQPAAGGDGESRTRVRKSIPVTFYERSLSIIIPYGTADRQAFLSVALLCVTDYKAVIRSHLLLNDTPYQAAVLLGERKPLIKQQEVLFRFCRLFLINRPFYSGQTPLLAYRSSKSPSKSFHPRIFEVIGKR